MQLAFVDVSYTTSIYIRRFIGSLADWFLSGIHKLRVLICVE